MNLKYINDTMKLASYCFTDENEWRLNKNIIQNEACFIHVENWEYIVYIPSEIEFIEDFLNSLTGGCKSALEEAIQNNFNYICFYTD